MRLPTLRESSEYSQTDTDEQIQAVTDLIKESENKTIEIRPADESKGRGKLTLLLIIGGALAVGYWLRQSENPAQKIQNVASETADRSRQVTDQASESIQESGESMSEQIEEGSQKASEQVQQTGEKAAEETEEAGEKAAEKADESQRGSSDSSVSL